MKNFPQFNFSAEQIKAINHFRGPALVVAGPGSGKTAVITHRVYNLITTYHVNPQNLLIITFSKAAALQMKQRFFLLGDDKSYPVYFGTFHSLFFGIIKKHYHLSRDNIVTEKQKSNYISKILIDLLKIKNPDFLFVENIIKALSYYKNTGQINLSQFDIDLSSEEFRLIFVNYRNMMKANRKIDFEDMMLLCFKLLKTNQEIRSEYTSKYKYILIDEFQDINSLQYEIIKLLLGKERNIFAVGDDDQSIYGFRGSTPGIMSIFPRDFENCELIMLTTNYRSTQNIVNLSLLLINQNRNRFPKDISTINEKGARNILCISDNRIIQARDIVSRIRNALKINPRSTIAVLFRTNSQMALPVETLKSSNIPFSCEYADNRQEQYIIKDFLAYIEISQTFPLFEPEKLIRIINKPYMHINPSHISPNTNSFSKLRDSYSNDSYSLNQIKNLEQHVKTMRTMDMYSSFCYFRNVIGYEKYINKRFNENRETLYIISEIILRLNNKMKEIKNMDDLKAYAERVCFKKDKSEMHNERVHLLTYHSSKGLEFDCVIIPDLNEGVVPEKRARSIEEIEEERRMLYVAFTRAQKELILMCVKGENDNKTAYSRFIEPLINNEELLDIKNVPG